MAQGFEVRVGVVGAVGLDDMTDGVGQPAAGGGAEQGRAAEAAQVDPGAGLSAGTCPDTAPGIGPGVTEFVASALMGTSGCVNRRTGCPRAEHGSGSGFGLPSGPVLDAIEPTTPD